MTYLFNMTLCLFALALPAFAATEAGPRGGRMLDNGYPRAEVLIAEDRNVSIAFYDQEKKQVPPVTQAVTAVAEGPQGKTRIEFERRGELLVSNAPLPEGEGYNIVFQLKNDAQAKMQNFRVKYEMYLCGECNHPEYACTCDE